MKVSVAPRGSRQSVLIFGPPKTGKTQLVSQLALTHKLIWFDLENGHATLFKLPIEAQERIELIVLKDTKTFPIAIETCLKVIKGTPHDICEEHGKIACSLCKKEGKPFVHVELNALDNDTIVVFDSLTQLTSSAIAHITKGKDDDYKMQTDDWGSLSKLMDVFASHVQQANFNVVCISHETETELEDGKIRIVPTMGSRNFSKQIAKAFGHVIYAEVKNMKHRFTSSTTASVNIITGSRTDVTLEKMNEPGLASIFTSNAVAKHIVSNDSQGIQSLAGGNAVEQPISGNTTQSTVGGQTNGQIAASSLNKLQQQLADRRKQNESSTTK